MLMFRREDRERVARGEITVTFRLWKSAHVRAGKTYESGFGRIEVEDVRVIPAAMISEDDIGPSGCDDVAAIRELAGEHTKAQVGPDTLLHRVQFRFIGDGAMPIEPRTPIDMELVAARLERMDRLAPRGPWTLAALRMIERRPRAAARLLAAELGYETLDFKRNVRKLKALGLTISHEAGYELSDGGRAYVASQRHRRAGPS
ncbi:MAG: ASCH domain-containing protein [Dehalococcoidia bacterium]|nr:MAG: ASCH domain-containing protein [Dehalococcoidia bacterium]